MQDNYCSGETRATRQSTVPGNAGHEIQQQHQVSASRNSEVAVKQLSGEATVGPAGSWQQQLQQQQPTQRQRQQQQQPSRNDSGTSLNFNTHKKTYRNLFNQLCTYDNLLLAYTKARKRKSAKDYVQQFELNLQSELYRLQWELLTGTYKPRPLKTFIVRDPKTRKISASNFRDRVVHHAICNIIEPIFESRFIYDTYANRKYKGTLATIKRFDKFMKKVSGPCGSGFALKADIKHYFDNVDHAVLLSILGKRIKDERLLQLIIIILENHKSDKPGKGMPLGNLTSQFFANVYLAELDNYVKHELRAKYYLRYVDDFIILCKSKAQLTAWKQQIDAFLQTTLKLSLHPDKTKIVPLHSGVQIVGFRVFYYYKLLKKSNLRRIMGRIERYKKGVADGTITPDHVLMSISGWEGYARMGNTFRLRQEIRKEIEGLS
ncbi:MAG: hypothetical protein EHM12_10920 [Dehalococcoidia bacterium]|nr:MAG: hypothetical protein EHM12_10920 [Dehalococcoidia bacterium]